MQGRLARLFNRYAARHLVLARNTSLSSGDGALRLSRLVLDDNRLTLTGTASARLVEARLGDARAEAAPDPATGDWRLDLPQAGGVLHLTAGGHTLTLVPFPAAWLALGRAGLLPAFLRDGLRALPAALRWFRHRDPAARAQVKAALRLGPKQARLVLSGQPFQTAAMPGPLPDDITVILPVYNAFDLLAEALDRVLRHTRLPCHLIVIEDASPDPRVRPYLRDRAAQIAASDWGVRLTLLENDTNLGFLGSVNRGFAAALAQGTGPVVLLNSDAMVPEGWDARLVAPLLTDAMAASVTPFSNDAELMSLPVAAQRSDLPPGAGDLVDAAAARLGQPRSLPAAPTGVGFCMALSRAALHVRPEFDTTFGRGYGEEVDWCQALRKQGWRHLCQPALFVEHRGGASFGSAAKEAAIQRASAIIRARYPAFDQSVQDFLALDPLLSHRLALGLVWAAQVNPAPVPVYLAHDMGGGAESWLRKRIADDIAAGGAAVVLRVGTDQRWQIELHAAQGIVTGITADTGVMRQYLGMIARRQVVYSCGVGDTDPFELPGLLLDLAGDIPPEVVVHDYFMVSPSFNLLDADRRFRGLPDPATADRAHSLRRPNGHVVALAEWQAGWRRLMQAAGRITVFSESSRQIIAQVWPDLSSRIALRPHAFAPPFTDRLPPLPGARPVIGVLGAIGENKGAAFLVQLSRRLARTREADLVVVGEMDPAYRLARPARVLGRYDGRQIPDLARRSGITCWLIPSICPETFSFTTRECLATGLPVLGFDLGAQGEAIAASAQGRVIALRDGAPDLDAVLQAVRDLA